MELKPCSFCGNLSMFLQRDKFAKCDVYYIKCYNCGACDPKLESSWECGFGYERDEAEEFVSKRWNERH